MTTAENREALLALLEVRVFWYMFLERGFASEPDGDYLDTLAFALGADASFADVDGGVEDARLRVMDAAQGIREAPELRLDELRSAYTRLFIGPTQLPVPAWESVFAEQKPVLFQRSTLAVRHFYASLGYKVAGHPHVADDFIASELGFMAAATRDAAKSAASGDVGATETLLESQLRFLSEHLGNWMDDYAERMDEIVGLEGPDGFYTVLAKLAAAFVRWDREALEETIELLESTEKSDSIAS